MNTKYFKNPGVIWLIALACAVAMAVCGRNHPIFYEKGFCPLLLLLGLVVIIGFVVSLVRRKFGSALHCVLRLITCVVVSLIGMVVVDKSDFPKYKEKVKCLVASELKCSVSELEDVFYKAGAWSESCCIYAFHCEWSTNGFTEAEVDDLGVAQQLNRIKVVGALPFKDGRPEKAYWKNDSEKPSSTWVLGSEGEWIVIYSRF